MASINMKEFLESIAQKLNIAKEYIIQKDFSEVPSEIIVWIKNHPYQAFLYVIDGIVFFYPGIVSAAVLRGIGAGGNGPGAGACILLSLKFEYSFQQTHMRGSFCIPLLTGVE